MKNGKAILIVISTVIISRILAVPVGRFYDQYYPSDYGVEVLFLGFILTFYFLSGLFFGIFYKTWYRSFLFVVFLILLGFDFWVLANDVSAAVIFLTLLIVAYALGFTLHRLQIAVRKHMIDEVNKAEYKR